MLFVLSLVIATALGVYLYLKIWPQDTKLPFVGTDYVRPGAIAFRSYLGSRALSRVAFEYDPNIEISQSRVDCDNGEMWLSDSRKLEWRVDFKHGLLRWRWVGEQAFRESSMKPSSVAELDITVNIRQPVRSP